jgi:hypothetical protein
MTPMPISPVPTCQKHGITYVPAGMHAQEICENEKFELRQLQVNVRMNYHDC